MSRRKGTSAVDPPHRVHYCRDDFFDCLLDAVFVPISAFEVELGELELSVGAEVLVAVATGDLEVALDSGDHQQLLEKLG